MSAALLDFKITSTVSHEKKVMKYHSSDMTKTLVMTESDTLHSFTDLTLAPLNKKSS